MTDVIMPAYNRSPISFECGEGVWLWDTQGEKYLDALSGIAVSVLGHCHPAILEAITQQAQKVLHVSNGFEIPQQEKLAQTLTNLSSMDQVFFANSGAEANEAAIKLARLYGHNKGIKNPTIIAMEGGFHGRTLATLSASGNRTIQAGFEPLVQGFLRAPYNDLEALETLAHNSSDIVAVMLEPILGNAGIIIPDEGYLKGIRKLCDDQGWLMILDEVQTGIGHTGQYFAYQHENIIPDVLTLAKALGNGIPIGACLAHGEAIDIFQPGKHGTTLGGNPFACHVSQAVLDTIVQEDLLNHVQAMSSYLEKQLRESLREFPQITEIRIKGLMIGIQLDQDCMALRKYGLEQGLIFNVTKTNAIRLLPPLIIQTAELDILIEKLHATLTAYFNEQ